MEKEFEFYGKDSLKLHCLREAVQEGRVGFRLFLESDGSERTLGDVRVPGQSRYRFNNFNIIEDPADNSLTFCPNVVGCYVYIAAESPVTIKAELIRKGGTVPAEIFELGEGSSKIEFCPQGLKMYIMKTETSAPLTPQQQETVASIETENRQLEEDISGFLRKKEELEQKKRGLIEKKRQILGDLETLKAECEKDYAKYEKDAEELKARYGIDRSVLEYYRNNGVTPVEELLAKADEAIKKAEDQIKVFVEAAEKRTADIENG